MKQTPAPETRSPASHEVFLNAVARHRDGHLAEAEVVYREILQANPLHADALHLLGVVLIQRGDPREGTAAIRRACAIAPEAASYLVNLAGAYRQLGEHALAVDCYRAALVKLPGHFDARLGLAAALRLLGRLDEAVDACRQAIAHNPNHPPAYEQLGHCLHDLRRFESAATAYARSLELKPNSPETLNNLANSLQELGRLDQAIATYRQALALAPESTSIAANLGAALRAVGQLQEAVDVLHAAARRGPDDPLLLHNLANVHRDLEQTIEAEAAYRQAIAAEPQFADAHAGLASLLEQQGDADRAAEYLAAAIKLRPLARWRLRDATILPPIYDSAEQLAERRHTLIEKIAALKVDGVSLDSARELVPLSFYLAYQGHNERELQQRLARLAPSSHVFRPVGSGRDARGRIRVGFLSRHLCEHTIGRLFQGLIADLDRRRFEVTLIAVNPVDDEIGRRLRNGCERFLAIGEHVPRGLADVAALDLDVLIYTDLGMEPVSWTLAHSRLAPVQCVTWGHPLTSGLPTIDYFLSSELFETDDADAHYTERLVRFSSLGIGCDRRPETLHRRTREELGLPADRPIYGCPQSLFKLHPEFDAVLTAILRRDLKGELVLLAGKRPEWEARLRARFSRAMPDVCGRIRFAPRLPREGFLSLLSASDVLLDPLHFGGGHTSLEAFGLGVPVVTLPSPFLRGRLTAGFYRRMDLSGLVATGLDDYVAKAIELANDRALRDRTAQQLHEASHVLFDRTQAVAELAEFLTAAYDARERFA